MQTPPVISLLPGLSVQREKLASIIADVCRCESAPLLADQDFSVVITQFDSLAILEILLEIETEYHIPTDEMLPADHAQGAQEIATIFPKNLSELIVYMQDVAARCEARKAAGEDDSIDARRKARLAAVSKSDRRSEAQTSGILPTSATGEWQADIPEHKTTDRGAPGA